MSRMKKLITVGLSATLILGCLVGCAPGKSNADTVIEKIEALEKKNAYIQLMIGPEQYIYLLYNKEGEAIAESSNGGIAFYRKDDKIVTLTDTEIIIDNDLSPLEFIKAATNVAKDPENGTIEKEITVNEETKAKNTLYTMTINGKENIKKVYDTLGNETYSANSIDMLYSGFEDVESSKMVVRVSTGENGELGAVCNVTFGEEEENEYTSWTFDGYIETFEWAFDEKWYSNDTSDVEGWIDLASNTINEISEKMAKFMQDNDIITDTSETGKITAEEFIGMTDTEKSQTIDQAINDIKNIGFSVSCSNEDLLKELNDYYAESEENKQINVFQAVTNIGTINGWITEIFIDGEQGGTEQEGAEQGGTMTEGNQGEEEITTEDNAEDSIEDTGDINPVE